MKIQWGSNCYSVPFNVSNGVRQGSVLSPVLFAVYLDGLLEELCVSGVGCHWRWMFTGAFCYADDLVLLAPCASALRTMLSICESYAQSHGLLFNADKTQLICFRKFTSRYSTTSSIMFNNIRLQFSDNVSHLGPLLSYNLNDNVDIIRVIKDINRKANSILCTFSF